MLVPARLGRRAGQQNPEHSSGSISSLLVAADVADDVGHILVAFLFVGDEGGIIVIVVFDGLVDLDVVFRLGNDGLDLAGILLGVGFFERNQLFGLGGLRHGLGGGWGRGGRGARRAGARHARPRHGRPAAAPPARSARPRRYRVRSPGSCSGHRTSCPWSGKCVWFRDRIWPRAESWEFFEKRCFTWLVEAPLSIAVCAHLRA